MTEILMKQAQTKIWNGTHSSHKIEWSPSS